jgi:hypothetical protein
MSGSCDTGGHRGQAERARLGPPSPPWRRQRAPRRRALLSTGRRSCRSRGRLHGHKRGEDGAAWMRVTGGDCHVKTFTARAMTSPRMAIENTAERVIVSAHAYPSAKLLHRLKHAGTLPGLSDQLGQRARTKSEQLPLITRTWGRGSAIPSSCTSRPGSVSITSACGPSRRPASSLSSTASVRSSWQLTWRCSGASRPSTRRRAGTSSTSLVGVAAARVACPAAHRLAARGAARRADPRARAEYRGSRHWAPSSVSPRARGPRASRSGRPRSSTPRSRALLASSRLQPADRRAPVRFAASGHRLGLGHRHWSCGTRDRSDAPGAAQRAGGKPLRGR